MVKKSRGKYNVQDLYDSGKLSSNEFYIGATNIIKSRLMGDLVWKGYYKDGVKQFNYDIEDVEDCFTYVLGKILEKYDPNKGKIATFIRNWVRGYGTTVIEKQVRRHRKIKTVLPLDLSLQTSIPEDFRDLNRIENIEDVIDNNSENWSDLYSNLEPIDISDEDIIRINKCVYKKFWEI